MLEKRDSPAPGRSGFVILLWAGLILASAACRKSDLTGLGGLLVFSSPDQPASVMEPDAGRVRIAFGEVTIAATKSLTLSAVSLGAPVTLVALNAIQTDPEFAFPLALGPVGASPGSQTVVSFTPGSEGAKSAIYQLTAAAPATGTITIELSGTGVPNGLAVSPNPVGFGAVEINHAQSISVTIDNVGQQSASLILSGLQGANASLFQLGTPTSTSLSPGASASLAVVFAPLTVGPFDASFTVSGSKDGPAVQVSLTGTGVQSWLQAASPVDFGFVQITDSFDKSALITNLSQYVTLHLTAPAPLVGQPNGSSAFSVGSLPALPLAIGPQQSAAIPLSFAPRSLGAFTGTLFVATDDPDESLLAIDLQGYGGGPHLTCPPSLDFGPVFLGPPVTEPVVCVNTGANIPGHPEIRLEIAQSGISSEGAAFTAALTLSDGGSAGQGDTVSLGSGQSARIDVTFHPDDAGDFRGRLGVVSNDLDDSDAGTLLSGVGFVPGPCELEANPRQLSFGEVIAGNAAILPFEVTNVGQSFCAVTDVVLGPFSDPSFYLPAGKLGQTLLSFPSNPDNPKALPTSMVINVQYFPTAPEEAATGTVAIDTLNVATPVEVSLLGSSQPACLDIQPPSYDFGEVGMGPTQALCAPATVTFSAENQCGEPITIYRTQINPGVGSAADFALENPLVLPLTIPAGGLAAFQVGFVPSGPGPKVGAVVVDSSEFWRLPFLLPLRGDAETSGWHTDTYNVPAASNKVDFLWVIDEDDDYTQVTTLTQLLPQLFAALDQAQIDYRMAVTSTDTCDAGASDRGSFEPCDHCLSSASADPVFVTPATSDPAGTLANLFGFFDVAPQVGFCTGLVGDEHFFDALAAALSPEALDGHNGGFLRPEAYLAVVMVNGDDEDDGYGAQPGSAYDTSLAQVTDLVRGLKPGPSLVSVSYINSGAGTLEAAQQIGQLVLTTGGQEIDTSIPADVWQASLIDLFTSPTDPGGFRLSTQPTSGGDIQVLVNGMAGSTWSYDARGNEIVFSPGQMPPSGATVTITYQVGCP